MIPKNFNLKPLLTFGAMSLFVIWLTKWMALHGFDDGFGWIMRTSSEVGAQPAFWLCLGSGLLASAISLSVAFIVLHKLGKL